MSEKVGRFVRFLSWLYAANRYRHWSLTCTGAHPCDPRAHLSLAIIWELSA